MGNLSMYETLMNLPLFSGAGEDMISAIIEKTHLAFEIYSPGKRICKAGSHCENILALISGKVSVSSTILGGDLTVTRTVGDGRFFGFEHLWGLDTKFPYTVTALERCGTIEFSKQQYMRLLHAHQLLLLNCLNYLSFSSQKQAGFIDNLQIGDGLSLINGILKATTSRDSEEIVIESRRRPIEDIFTLPDSSFGSAVKLLVKEGLVEIESSRRFRIISRSACMNYLSGLDTV